jgi:cysteinyl-tRNA synthetase
MVTTGGVKMGKSLGNSAYLRDLYKQYDPLSLRFTILQSHYRGTTEFTEDAIKAASAGYGHLRRVYDALWKFVPNPLDTTLKDQLDPYVVKFIESMDNDFNTPQAITVLYDLLGPSYDAIGKTDFETGQQLYQIWNALAGKILGILPSSQETTTTENYERLIQIFIRRRKEARDRRDFATSDSIRKELEEAGIILEDTKDGTTWRLK